MEWTDALLGTPFLCGSVFVIIGLVLYFFPSSRINAFYGYRTPQSMSSPEKWQFSQRFSALRLMESGAFLLLLSLLPLLIFIGKQGIEILSTTSVLTTLLYSILTTEIAMKKRFPKK